MPHDPERRESLKIIGAIGATCIFPFPSQELYGQHAHDDQGPAPRHERQFFTEPEFTLLSALVDEIIPPTDTPGATAAGVPGYIDFVARSNKTVAATCREGLAWLGEQKFLAMKPARREKLLRTLCSSAEVKKLDGKREKFWLTVKSLTADGYYTSKPGLRDELGYLGNTALESFPACPEH